MIDTLHGALSHFTGRCHRAQTNRDAGPDAKDSRAKEEKTHRAPPISSQNQAKAARGGLASYCLAPGGFRYRKADDRGKDEQSPHRHFPSPFRFSFEARSFATVA
jgi:hypothetical protein